MKMSTYDPITSQGNAINPAYVGLQFWIVTSDSVPKYSEGKEKEMNSSQFLRCSQADE